MHGTSSISRLQSICASVGTARLLLVRPLDRLAAVTIAYVGREVTKPLDPNPSFEGEGKQINVWARSELGTGSVHTPDL